MNFECLTYCETEGVDIQWSKNKSKTKEIIASAISAGFSESEVKESPLGILNKDFKLMNEITFKAGAVALVGSNGLTLIQVSI